MILITLLQMRSLLNDTKMYLQKKNVDTSTFKFYFKIDLLVILKKDKEPSYSKWNISLTDLDGTYRTLRMQLFFQ